MQAHCIHQGRPGRLALLITQCPDPLMWYSNAIRTLVPFVRAHRDPAGLLTELVSRESAGYTNIIRPTDCRILHIADDGQHISDVTSLITSDQCTDAREISDLQQQLEDEKRQHDITRGELERTRLVRDEALQDVAQGIQKLNNVHMSARADRDENTKLRTLVHDIAEKRHTYGWGPEADAAIDAARLALNTGNVPADRGVTPTEEVMLDFIEQEANQPGGLLLHSEENPGRRGLGLGSTGRTPRQAIAQALGHTDWKQA